MAIAVDQTNQKTFWKRCEATLSKSFLVCFWDQSAV